MMWGRGINLFSLHTTQHLNSMYLFQGHGKVDQETFQVERIVLSHTAPGKKMSGEIGREKEKEKERERKREFEKRGKEKKKRTLSCDSSVKRSENPQSATHTSFLSGVRRIFSVGKVSCRKGTINRNNTLMLYNNRYKMSTMFTNQPPHQPLHKPPTNNKKKEKEGV